MKKELPYFYIGSSYGGNQDWFADMPMRFGGCAAETACELCIYLDLYFETKLYPFDKDSLTKRDYVRFASMMKPYLKPRFSGVNRLDIYTEGFGAYLADNGSDITLEGVDGDVDYESARSILKAQLDRGIPVPYLNLNHKDRRFKDYVWHWFIINGYDETDGAFLVKAVNYSTFEWMNFHDLWETGSTPKGGFILIKN